MRAMHGIFVNVSVQYTSTRKPERIELSAFKIEAGKERKLSLENIKPKVGLTSYYETTVSEVGPEQIMSALKSLKLTVRSSSIWIQLSLPDGSKVLLTVLNGTVQLWSDVSLLM